MNTRGQVFSLDFLMAVSMIVLAIGLSINYFEANQLNQKETENQNALWNRANTAMDILLTRPDIPPYGSAETFFICTLKNSSGANPPIDYIPNCLPPTLIVDRTKIGLPAKPASCSTPDNNPPGYCNYCKLTWVSGTVVTFQPQNPVKDCDDTLPLTQQNYVSIQRKIVVANNDATPRDISKAQLLTCQNGAGGCVLTEAVIQLTVWKNE